MIRQQFCFAASVLAAVLYAVSGYSFTGKSSFHIATELQRAVFLFIFMHVACGSHQI
jgi:hypothetical protein